MTAPTISAGNVAHALVRAASRLISTPGLPRSWGRLPACGPIVKRSIRAQPGHLNRHASQVAEKVFRTPERTKIGGSKMYPRGSANAYSASNCVANFPRRSRRTFSATWSACGQTRSKEAQ